MQINFFNTGIEKFIASLEKATIAKVLRTLNLLEKFGHQLGMPHSKKVAAELFELRIRGVQEVRIFYMFSKGSIVLLHGFIKKSSRIPPKELAAAIQRQAEVKSRA